MKPDSLTREQKTAIRTAVKDAGGVVAFANKTGINRGLVSMAFNDRYISPKIARLVGIRTPVEVDPCPTCGDKAHGYDCSKQSIIEKSAESKRYNRKRPPRLSIDKFRAELAASSITGNTTPEYIDTLIELLDQWRDNQ